MCETKQMPSTVLIDNMGKPDAVIPLDTTSVYDIEKNIGFPNQKVFITELQQSSFFDGKSSYIETKNSGVSSKYGITIGMWLKMSPDDPDGGIGPKMLVEFTKPEKTNMLQLLIENKKLSIKMCITPDCSTSENFSSKRPIVEDAWNYVAFTYDEFSKNGTFIIKDTYGNGDSEGLYFHKDSEGWFPNAAGPGLKIGLGYLGQISCLQIMNRALKIAEIKKLSLTCYLDEIYNRPKACPEGYIQMHKECLKISESPYTYAEAVVDCISPINDPFVTRLSFPGDFQMIENIIQLSKETRNITELYIGLDSMSGILKIYTFF